MRDDIRTLNLLKRLRSLAEMEKNYSIKAVAEELEASVHRLLKAGQGPDKN